MYACEERTCRWDMAFDPERIFADLSPDPLLASYELLQRVDKVMQSGEHTDTEWAEACALFEAFYDANSWKPPARIDSGGYSSSDDPAAVAKKTRWFQRLQYEAYVNQIMLNYRHVIKQKAKAALDGNTAKTPGYAVLDSDEKREISAHIERIRSIIQDSGLDDGKKNNLFDRLTDLASEVNRNGTRTDRFFAFASELSFCVGKMTRNAKPAIEETKAMLRIVYQARARQEGIQLPPGEDVPLLPEPKDEEPPEAEH